jgi:hypothetical protein
MAGAQYEADDTAPNQSIRWGRVAAMGVGYLASALIPGIGFAFSLRAGWIVFIPTAITILVVITWTRSARCGWAKAAVTTAAIFILAVAAGLAASLIGG